MGKGMKAGKKKKPAGAGSGNMQQQLKQMQAMQREMEEIQESLGERETTATAGGGAIEVTVNGNREITNIVIDKDVVDPDDVEMLQDLVMAAVNEALRQIEDIIETEMNKVTGNISIPGL